MTAVLILACLAPLSSAWDVARTPPMGWNSFNYWHGAVNATILMDTAQAIVQTGLAKAGYQYVNSDDCWMLAERDAKGNQVANPDKFPEGFQAVTKYIHSLGLSSGLYTARGPRTCQGLAASCDHEEQDAAQWASWGIDYVKDDACSTCDSYTDDEIYGRMWQAIQASGRPMVLTVEGNPTDSIITLGGYGNAKRVGHDITPTWESMTSLVDVGADLWMYAHNSTNSTFGGWWNDLDMLEVGNGEFACAESSAALLRCQAHFTMWTIMKAPLIMGNNVLAVDAVTLSVLTNTEAIAVNQDPWGNQAQRVARLQPANTTGEVSKYMYFVPCNASDARQTWAFTGPSGQTQLKNLGTGTCVDASLGKDPVQVAPCTSLPSQVFTLETSGHIQNVGGNCLDIFNFTGPDVDLWGCKSPGEDSDQQFVFNAATGVITSPENLLPANSCLSAVPSKGDVLEVWAGLLSGNRWAIALFNRTPADNIISADWSMFNVSSSASFTVRDIWAAEDKGTFTGSYTAPVPAQSAVYLVLTPA